MPARFLEAVVVFALSLASVVAAWVLPGRGAAESTVVVVPIAWALLFLYVPVRLAGWAMWREVRTLAPDSGVRRGLALLLLLGFGLMTWGLGWGLWASSWAADELLAGQVRELIQRHFGDGWYDKYPVMHYAVLAIPVSAFELATRLGILSAESLPAHVAQLALMRLVSSLMGLGMLIGTWLCAAELSGPRRAIFAPLVLLLTPLTLYYGKVANLDVPFMCFFAWAMLGFVRVWKAGRLADYLLLGLAAAAAVATKDQAYASLVLLPIAVVVATARTQAWARLLAGGAASLVAFAVLHNVPFNAGGVLEHFRLLSTLGDLAIVPRTAAGYVDMTTLSVRLFRFALGWPFAILALVGLFQATRRPDRRWWLWFLLVPASFHVTFTWVTLYVNDRYLFPGVFVMALFAGAAIADLVDSGRGRRLARGVAAVAVGYSLLHAASVNVMMDLDARDDASAWLAREAPAGAPVALIGGYEPSVFPPLRASHPRASVEDVRSAGAEFVVLNWRFAQRYLDTRSPDGRNLLAALEDGSLGYVEVYRHRGRLPAWAVLRYDPEFTRARESTWTNLDKINPEVRIYRRLPDAPREARDERR